jgi:cobalt-zinc-cadmium efflux system outer membrane protein
MSKWYLLILSVIAGGMESNAETPAVSDTFLSFAAAREIILSRNVGLQSAITETEAAEAGVSQAGVRPNPGIEITTDKFGANEFQATVQQTIELGGKRRLRLEAAQKVADVSQNNHRLSRIELEVQIIRRFIPIAAIGKKLSLLDSIIEIAASTHEQVQKRVEAGSTRKTDLIRAEIGIEQLKLERNELVRAGQQACKKFAALGLEQDSRPINVSGSISHDTEIPSIDDLQNAIKNSPAITLLEIKQEQLETQRKLVRAQVVPDLNASAGYLRNTIDNYESPLMGLSMNIPLFNQNTAAQKQVELERKAIGERREYTLRILGAEAQDIHSRLLVIDQKITTLRESTIPKASNVYSLMEGYYNAGNAGFIDLAATQSEMLRLKIQLYDIQTERAQLLADLMQLTSLTLQIVK